jgi:hypothetical protein
VACTALSKLPKIREGLVIPRDSRFINLDGEKGTLKVPAGISLQEQGRRSPQGSARVLLALLDRNPRIVEETLGR